MIQKAAGDYDGALASLADARRQYPRDRVVLEPDRPHPVPEAPIRRGGRSASQQTLRVDPEDLQAHYNLMLCYRGLGQTAEAEREEQLFRRFKADESSQAITAAAALLSPEDNNERQPIHDHDTRRCAALLAAWRRRRCRRPD